MEKSGISITFLEIQNSRALSSDGSFQRGQPEAVELELSAQPLLTIRELPGISLDFQPMENLLGHSKLDFDVPHLTLSPLLKTLAKPLQL